MGKPTNLFLALVALAGCGFDGSQSDKFAGVDQPIVFAHGFASTGWDDSVIQALTVDGIVAVKATVPPIDSIAVRARALGAQIDTVLAQTGAERVHVVGHSMGGLDARYLVARLGYADRVSSITTIATPHRGSPLADVGLGVVDYVGLDEAALAVFAELFATDSSNPNLRVAVADLTERNAPAFNDGVPDARGVHYQSLAALSTVGGRINPNDLAACENLLMPEVRDHLRTLFVLTAAVVSGTEQRPHDGVVSVASARWGQFRGCIPADHGDANAGDIDSDTGFSRLEFYRQLAGELVGRR